MGLLPNSGEYTPSGIDLWRAVCLLLRAKKNQQAPSIKARPMTPPTTPPTFAAKLLSLLDLAGERVCVVACGAEDTASETAVWPED